MGLGQRDIFWRESQAVSGVSPEIADGDELIVGICDSRDRCLHLGGVSDAEWTQTGNPRQTGRAQEEPLACGGGLCEMLSNVLDGLQGNENLDWRAGK